MSEKEQKEEKKETIGKISPRILEEEMQSAYLDYAMSVIVSRALPDVRDGLKPVHRRILYSMWESGLRAGSKYSKCAGVVGDVLKKYHPHGDTAVYDSLVRMAQPWSLRYLLIDGQGNFGSLDGDSAAAYRYTEARLAAIAEEMLLDIEKETVRFTPNFDSATKEPTVLPAKLPNLLINGSMGIAVGMATNIPPHNLSEVIDGTVYLIDHPEATMEEITRFIKGPDFPTGGLIYNPLEIKAAYAAGRGRILIRARAEIEEAKKGQFRIIVSEIPYQVNKAELIIKIAELVKTKKIEGIADIRDESGRHETVRIVIELKSNAFPQKVLNRLFILTSLQTTFHLNMLALVDGLVPRVLTLKSVLEHYLAHRLEVITKKALFEKKRAEERAHILEGLTIALDHIDAIIALIRASETRDEAKKKLIIQFKLTPIQAEAILEMRLSQLAGLERRRIETELALTKALIVDLALLLSTKTNILTKIKEELLALREKYGDARRTEIVEKEVGEFKPSDVIPNQQEIITITNDNYIKRVPAAIYQSQHRGGKGIIGLTTKEEDYVKLLISTFTHNRILFFTDKGRVFEAPVFDLPAGSRQSKGQAMVNLLPLSSEEKVTTAIAFNPKETAENHYFFLATKNGSVKRVAANSFGKIRKSGIIAITLQSGDLLNFVEETNGSNQIFIVTQKGQAIRFFETDVRVMGRTAAGVRGIDLRQGDEVISMEVIAQDKVGESDLLVVLENGFGKKTKVSSFNLQRRGGIGLRAAKTTAKTGPVVKAQVTFLEKGDLVLISKMGQMIRVPLKAVKRLSRSTQGVRLMRLNKGDLVASAAFVKGEPLPVSEPTVKPLLPKSESKPVEKSKPEPETEIEPEIEPKPEKKIEKPEPKPEPKKDELFKVKKIGGDKDAPPKVPKPRASDEPEGGLFRTKRIGG